MKTTTFCNIWRLFIRITDHFYLKKNYIAPIYIKKKIHPQISCGLAQSQKT